MPLKTRTARGVALTLGLLVAGVVGVTLGLRGAGDVAPSGDAQMVFNRGNQAEPTSLDPHKGTDAQSSRIGYDLFEGLFSYGPDGKVVPGAAERHEVSEDGLTYTFFLRPEGRWSDGTTVTAHDFVYAWRRLVDPNIASDYAYFLWPVKNAEAVSAGKMPLDAMGVEAVNDLTLKVTLEKPTGYFLASLVHRMTYPVQKKNFETLGAGAVGAGKLVSNGAYTLAEHVPQSFVKLVKNPNFREAKSVKIDTVFFHHSDSPETELRRFRAGELDIVQMAPVTQIDWLKENMPEVMRFYPVFSTAYMPVNMTKEPWKSNPELRRALYLAVDRQALVEKITKSGERPAWTITGQGSPGYPLPLPPEAAMTQDERDALALKLLAEAGYGPGATPLELEVLHSTNESTRKVVVAIAAMWQQKLGAKVTLNNQEWKVVLQKAGEKDYPGLTFLAWIGDFPDPYTFVKLFRGDVGKMNRAGYADPAYDALLDEANATLDPAARLAKMAAAEKKLVEEAPFIPLYHATYRNLVDTKVKGWFETPFGVQPTRYLSVER